MGRSTGKLRSAALACLGAMALAPAGMAGVVKTDGSLGKGTALSGPTFAITPDLGKQVGGNLFHSFALFNLDKGEVASFSGPTSVHNVLARVTGGQSTIDGTLQCTIPDANFYLINPAGVVFGPDAKLDVRGSFAVTSADYIKLADGAKFGAPGPADTLLTTAAPAAFGFLSANPGGIAVRGNAAGASTLAVDTGKVLSVVGGTVEMTAGQLTAADGRINVVSVASPGEVILDPASVDAPAPVLSRISAAGSITLVDIPYTSTAGNSSIPSVLSTDGVNGGQVFVLGGSIRIDGGKLSANGSDPTASPQVNVNALSSFTLTSGVTDAPGTLASSGIIALNSPNVILDNNTAIQIGAPGIFINADTIQVVSGTYSKLALNSANSNGTPGTIQVTATSITADGLAAKLLVDSYGRGRFATAGRVVLDSTLGPAGAIDGPDYAIPSTLGRQVGNNLFFSFAHFDIGDEESATFSGPASVRNVLARVTDGSPSLLYGPLNCSIAGANLFLMNPAGIVFGPHGSLNTSGSFAATTADYIGLADGARFATPGLAGANDANLTGQDVAAFGFLTSRPLIPLSDFNGVITSSNAVSPPGGIAIKGAVLSVPAGQVLSLIGGSLSLGSGTDYKGQFSSAASITATSGRINVVSAASPGEIRMNPTSLDGAIDMSNIGARGTVVITGQTMSADGPSDGSGPGGRVVLMGGDVLIDSSTISARATGAGGSAGISIDAAGIASVSNSTIDTSTSGSGNAGNIDVTVTGTLSLQSATITASSNFAMYYVDPSLLGTAGNITLAAPTVAVTSGSEVSSSHAGMSGGQISLNSSAVTLDQNTAQLRVNAIGVGTFYTEFGKVTLDGSFGPGGPVPGYDYLITPGMGLTVGSNLFQSFSDFKVAVGETVTFSGPSSINNVLVRVTGSAADINGTVHCTIPGANLFLLDSAGITFGADMSLNIGGSFMATTANSIRLADGKLFGAPGSADSLLTSSDAAALEFTSANPAGITLNGAKLSVNPGKVLSIAGGAIESQQFQDVNGSLTSSYLTSDGGRINLLSVTAGEARLNPTDVEHDPDLSAVTQRGAITIDGATIIDAGGGTGGRIAVQGADVVIKGQSSLTAVTNGSGSGRGIYIDATHSISLIGSTLDASAGYVEEPAAGATAGDITLNAPLVVLDGRGANSAALNVDSHSTTAYLADVTVTLDISSADDSHVGAFLSSPGGGTVHLFLPDTTTGANFTGTTFDDHAASSIAGTGPYTGRFLPYDPFGVLVGQSASGSWSVYTGGSFPADTSTFSHWSLQIGTHRYESTDTPMSYNGIYGVTSTITVPTSGLVVTGEVAQPAGPAGNIHINAQTVQSFGNVKLSAATTGDGAKGTVSVVANKLIVDGLNSLPAQLRVDDTGVGTFVASSNIVLDGSLGAAPVLTGPDYMITADLGIQTGGNLFHSFSHLDIAPGDSVTFTGPASVRNVLVRVTGGTETDIDGSLSCTIPGANFFLMNSAGIAFGPGATLNLPGAFAVTTADAIHLAGNGIFNAVPDSMSGTPSVLLGGDPDAFQFTAALPAGVAILGAQTSQLDQFGDPTLANSPTITLTAGSVMSIVSGPIQVVSTNLNLPGGQFNAIAVGSPGQVIINPLSPGTTPDVSGVGHFADASFLLGTAVTLDGPAGGRAFLRSANLTFDHSSLTSTTLADGNGTGLDIVATGAFNGTQANIATGTMGTGAAGDISVSAGSLMLDALGSSNGVDNFGVHSESFSAGLGGAIKVNVAGLLEIYNGAVIAAVPFNDGDGGSLSVSAGSVILDGQGASQITGIITQTQAGLGKAGDITLSASGSLQIRGGAELSASTFSAGNGGNISVQSPDITLDAGGAGIVGLSFQSNLTGISAESNVGATGSAGNINVQAGALTIINGGAEIDSGAQGSGNGGTVNVSARTLLIDERGSALFAGITSGVSNGSAGSGGTVTVSASTILLTGGGQISTATHGPGAGGSLFVTADSLIIDGTGTPTTAGVYTSIRADAFAAGAAGNISVQASDIQMLHGGRISAFSFSDGASGSVAVSGKTILLDGVGAFDPGGITVSGRVPSAAPASGFDVSVTASQSFTLSNGAIVAADAFSPDRAGSILVSAPSVLMTSGSSITAKSYEGGAGGNIEVDAPASLKMFDAVIAASNYRGTSPGGQITINSPDVILNQYSSISAGTGGGLAQDLAATVMFDTASLGFEADVYLVSPAGTRVQLSLTADKTTYSDATNQDTRPVGFFGLFTAKDLDGVWKLQVQTQDNVVTLNNWSLSLGGQVIGSTAGAPQSGTSFSSSLAVAGVDPGLTGGLGGSVRVNATKLNVLGGSVISSGTTGSGPAGDVTINARTVDISGAGSLIDSRAAAPPNSQFSAATGDAGDINITAGKNLFLEAGGAISTTSLTSAGGDIHLDARSTVGIYDGLITAKSGAAGGNIFITADRLIDILDSTITARAAGNGGSIIIDPPVVLLANSVIDGRSGGRPVQVRIVSDGFLLSQSQILTDTHQDFPPTDIVGSLVLLHTSLTSANARLLPECGLMLDGNLSSFIVKGQGGLAPGPDGLLPGFQLLLPDDNRRGR